MEEILPLDGDAFGVLALPAGSRRCKSAVVLLNAGLIHRVGPFRLHVQLARVLAARGIPTLRFDMPGIGDNLAVNDGSAEDVVQAAISRMASRTGCTDFVVGGICSAADIGWKVALADARVRGLILLDGVAYRNLGFHLRKILRGLRRPARAAAVVSGLWRRKRGPSTEPDPLDFRDWPSQKRAPVEFAMMLDRGVRPLLIYTGGVRSYFDHPSQLRRTLGPRTADPLAEVRFWPECDHTYFLPLDRQRLVDTISIWIGRHFGGAA
jgi:hypothetical protein